MNKERVKRQGKRLFLLICMVTIVFSNFLTFIPSNVYAEEVTEEVIITEPKTHTQPNDQDPSQNNENETILEVETPIEGEVPREEHAAQEEAQTEQQEKESTNEQDKQPSNEEPQQPPLEANPIPENETTTPEQNEQDEPTKTEDTEDFNKNAQLLITELSPNSNGADNYEYFEVYNNSNQPLSLVNYSFIYRYTDSGKEISFQVPAKIIQPEETLVFWYNTAELSLDEFNSHFGIQLTEEQVVQFKEGFPGFANGGNRTAVIKDSEGNDITAAGYLPGETDNTGLVVQYKYAQGKAEMEKHQVLAQPSPGAIEKLQVPEQTVALPEQPTDTEAPIISHKAVTKGNQLQPLTFEAIVTDDQAVHTVTLHIKAEGDNQFTQVPMKKGTENESSFSVTIPGTKIQKNMIYYIEATDGHNYAKTDEIKVEINIPQETFSKQPLLITELAPNSEGGGTDYYEFFELYNNTNQPLAISNYTFIYKYTDTGKEVPFQVPAKTINPQESVVLWFNNGKRTLTQFNATFSSNLTPEQVIEYTDPAFPGFANGGNRAIVIKDNTGAELVSASYLGSENDNTGADIHYTFATEGTEMVKYQVLATPTPGMIDSVQVPTKPVELEEVPVDEEAPVITHTPIKEAEAFSPVVVDASVTDNLANPFVTLHYKKEGDESYTALTMTLNAETSTYSAVIPGNIIDESITYYVEASDGTNTAKTETYAIDVKKSEVDYTKIPKFLVTEVVPDTTNVGSADGYEFIEIYNNTDKDLSFKDYKIQYRYGTDPASDVVWPSIPDDVVIPSQRTLVFWIINGQNTEATVADFNANYGTSLVENKDIVRIYSDGMANGSTRGLVVATNTKEEISVAYYNEEVNIDDTVPDKGIVYKYPEDGSTKSVKVSAGIEAATPGHVEPFQVPKQQIHIEDDSIAPQVVNKTTVTEAKETDDIEIAAEATDNIGVKSVRLLYRTNQQEHFNEVLLQLDSETNQYKSMIYAADLIAKEVVEYYFVASDGINETKSEPYQIKILSDIDSSDLRLNIKNNDILSGTKIVKGTSNHDKADDLKLLIDGEEKQAETFKALEHQAYIALEVSGLNMYFKNAVTMGEDILYLMDKDTLAGWKTFTIPVDADRLNLGENTLTVRAGNKASPFQLEESEENRDDYSIRNIRLILADGTVLRDPAKNDPAKVFDMGDDGTYRPFEDFKFTINEEHTGAKSYAWDTTAVADGEHTVTVKDSKSEVSSVIQVDNTAPNVKTTVEEGKDYKGPFTIDTDVTDEIAGVQTVKVLLDDNQITVPYETASSKLTPGEHTLTIIAEDKVGNKTEENIRFSVNNENPYAPELVSPADGLSTRVDGDPNLKVKVSDPTNDEMDVTFYKGYQYDAADTKHIKAYKHANEIEPPSVMVPDGEESLTSEDISLIAEQDGNYLTTNSDTKFPYHRFDVTIDNSIDENDEIELSWTGHSLEGRKVSMYAWNHETNKWDIITYKIAGTDDFELKGNVTYKEYVNDSNINVLVQDEIPSSPDEYDYTFVWMSDTQYYSESYPYIFEKQTNWIAEMQEEMKIKYVFHTGDLVDESDKVEQWQYADKYMAVLDEHQIPYGVLAGNHDVDQLSNDYTEYYKWFGEDRFKDKDYYGESYKNNRGHYDLISANGNDFIMVYMGWGVEAEDLEWLNKVLSEYPDRKAILNFHEYLLVSGNRSPIGETIYTEVVEKNPNVMAVLSGHYHDSETLVSKIDDNGDGEADRKVYQMLGDYQGGPEGGQGYMKLLHFDQDNNRIIVNTYSPYLDDYNFYDPEEFPGKDEMIIDFDLQIDEKQVATDYFTVNVKTDEKIGNQENIQSGDTAEVTWKGLTENETYSWYAVAKDNYTGSSQSAIWSFVKGENNKQGPDDGEQPGEGEEQPGEGDEQPGEGEEQPGEGDEQPGKGDGQPGNGEEKPGEGEEQPDMGEEQPGDKEQPSKDEDKSGQDDNAPVKDGDKTNTGDNKQQERPASPSDTISKDKGSFNVLPHTATNQLNYLLVGFIILAIGLIARKKRSSSN
ncbi:lamin tail domain-containing protein [Metabacillus malikii]|uniref:LPXTG-motif cell wall-anchored protein n=1 Tax=Metabacillus malikii TaxID=1504265 RepID=A0ABT9ZIR8_9BACI|nr:lamin tail domain-containing protein [Metabacillus malikii]MDQ0232157.1 LPXTG-motif cell wall-anchored protein [Metabacillus malikii]